MSGKPDEALRLHRAAYQASFETLGKDHVTTLSTASRLGQTLHRMDINGEAESLLAEVADSFERTLGAGAGETIVTRRALARVYLSQARHDEARKQLARALAGAQSRSHDGELVREIEKDLARLNSSSRPSSDSAHR